MDEINVNVITLEDEKKYIIIGALVLDNIKYLVLSKMDEPEVIKTRKIILENGIEYVDKLDSREEVEKVMKEYYIKYNRGNINE